MFSDRPVISILITVEPKSMECSHLGPVADGSNISIWCMSSSSNPPVNIRWIGSSSAMVPDYSKISSGEFSGEMVLNSTFVVLVNKTWNRNIMSYMPSFNGVLLKNLSVPFLLNVTCK